MISLSRFFDSSDFRSFIRSWRQSIPVLCYCSNNSHHSGGLWLRLGWIPLTLPRRDLKVCLISCRWALLLCATMSMIASSSVPGDSDRMRHHVLTTAKGTGLGFEGCVPNPFMAFLKAWASAAGSKFAAGRNVGRSWEENSRKSFRTQACRLRYIVMDQKVRKKNSG